MTTVAGRIDPTNTLAPKPRYPSGAGRAALAELKATAPNDPPRDREQDLLAAAGAWADTAATMRHGIEVADEIADLGEQMIALAVAARETRIGGIQ